MYHLTGWVLQISKPMVFHHRQDKAGPGRLSNFLIFLNIQAAGSQALRPNSATTHHPARAPVLPFCFFERLCPRVCVVVAGSGFQLAFDVELDS